MNISIIIPNYNGANLLKHNIPRVIDAIESYQHGHVQIIIIDDGSTDESGEILKDLSASYDNLSIIYNEKNFGFSTTVNNGVVKAAGEILILLNTDVIPEKGFLEKVTPHFSDQQVFGVGFMDKSVEGEQIVLRGRGIIRWYRGFILHEWGETSKTNSLWVSGGSGAFRRSLWEKIGGLNELYNPFYWEDIDISYRAIKQGYDIHFDNNITAIHEHEKGAIKTLHTNSKVESTAYRNQCLFFWLNITDTLLIAKHILWLPIHFINAFRDGNMSFCYGFFQAFLQLPRVLHWRRNNKKNAIVNDRQILKKYHS